jgi:hypothetical protein
MTGLLWQNTMVLCSVVIKECVCVDKWMGTKNTIQDRTHDKLN